MLTELVDIRPYCWAKLPPCGFFEVLGKRGTGKTTWTQFILQFSPTQTTGMFVVIAGSETAKNSWSQIVHPVYIHDPDIARLESIRDTQNALVRIHNKANTPFPDAMKLTLIFDDVSSNKKLMRSNILAYLASNSRHLQMSIYILAQYHCQIVTEVRNQFDYVFVLATSDDKSVRRIHSEYCSVVDLRVFRHVLSHVTQDHGMLVVNNQCTDSSINEVCFHSSMPIYPPPLKPLGSKEAREFAQTHYRDEDDARPDEDIASEWDDKHRHKPNHVIVDRKGKLIIRKA